jgi:hypothetical protein
MSILKIVKENIEQKLPVEKIFIAIIKQQL